MGLIAAVIAGLIASLIGAAVWAGITVATGYKIGLVAIGIGLIVGFAVRFAGKGDSLAYGLIGGGFALFGCALGNFFSVVAFASKEMELGFFQILMTIDPSAIGSIMVETFAPMDLLFYAIAVYEGFKFSIFTEGAE